MLKLSVIMAAYLEEEVIGDTLFHWLDEIRYPDLEIIVAVDTEEDKTYEIVKQYAKKYSNLKVDFSPDRRGFAVAIDSALRKARGDIIVKGDADIRYVDPSECMFNIAKHFEDPTVGGITFKWKPYSPDIIAEKDKGWASRGEIFINELVSDWREDNVPVIKGEWKLPLVVNAYRRKIVPRLDTKVICDDAEYGYRILEKDYKIVFAADVIHYFVGVPGDAKRLFLQKRRGTVGWFKMSKARNIKIYRFYSKLIGYYLTHFYKYSLEECIALFYWCIVFVTVLIGAYSKRNVESKKIWIKYKRDVK